MVLGQLGIELLWAVAFSLVFFLLANRAGLRLGGPLTTITIIVLTVITFSLSLFLGIVNGLQFIVTSGIVAFINGAFNFFTLGAMLATLAIALMILMAIWSLVVNIISE